MRLEKIPLITKIFFAISTLILFIWVLPVAYSYYDNRSLYVEKLSELERFDSGAVPIEIKSFNSELFKTDAKRYFDEVEIISASNSSYSVTVVFDIDRLPEFYKFLKSLPLNYRVSLEDKLLYKEQEKRIEVSMVVKPY
jgi:hypothetical protein